MIEVDLPSEPPAASPRAARSLLRLLVSVRDQRAAVPDEQERTA